MKLSTDHIVSLSALFVGLGSLFIIVYQTYLITYKSVYDERWRVTSDKIVPERLD